MIVEFQAVAKTLTVSQLSYLREQFALLRPNKSGYISLQSFKSALVKYSTEAMKDSWALDFVNMVTSLQYGKLDFEEFAAAATSVHQLEALDSWEQHARRGYEFFEKDGNRPIMIEELASASEKKQAPEDEVNDGNIDFNLWLKGRDGDASNDPKSTDEDEIIVPDEDVEASPALNSEAVNKRKRKDAAPDLEMSM